jgi:DNA invertase Pin-like site-specific DNA recombinase
VDRLARRASHALAIDEELPRFGAGCMFLEQNIDTTTDN